MKDYTILIYGRSGSGKSTSLRNLPQEKIYYLNVEGKDLPYRHSKLNKHVKPTTLTQVQESLKEAVTDDSVEIIIVDSITMLGEILAYNAFVKDSGDSRGGWLHLRDWMVNMIEFAKKSEKTFIFIGLEMDIMNEKEYVTETRPKMVGSLKDSLSSHFTTVLRSIVRDVDGEIKYQFQTNRTSEAFNTECKSPMGMFEPYIDNDMALVLQRMNKYYSDE